MNLRALGIAASALLMAASVPALAQAAGKGGGRSAAPAVPSAGARHHHGGARHQHRGPRTSIGIGFGFGFGGGFFDPYYDPFFYDGYPPYAYGYVPPPPVPCTAADIPTRPPTDNQFSADWAYDRIDAARCSPEAIAAQNAVAAAAAQAPVQQPGFPQPAAYYFCRSANGYYPQVAQCAEGWEEVAPRPPGAR